MKSSNNTKVDFTALIALLFFPSLLIAQQAGQIQVSKVPVVSQHYLPEYAFDKPTNPEEWKKQKNGLSISFASIDELYLRSEVPKIQETLIWQKTGWRGERLNAQVLVWSPDSIDQVRITLNDLKKTNGKIISRENIGVQLVRYVLSQLSLRQQAMRNVM